MPCGSTAPRILILGIGNLLMGDEGAGVEAVRRLQALELPSGVTCLDGGTGSFTLLEAMQQANRIVLIDAALDCGPPGTVRRLLPRFARDYPPTLTAHDIGLRDLLDAFHLLGATPEVVLIAITVRPPTEPQLGLSPAVAAALPAVVELALREAGGPSRARGPAPS